MNKYNEMTKFLHGELPGEFLVNEPLRMHTWYRVGGNARFFVYPESVYQVRRVLERADSLEMPVFVLGDGANVLASDQGFDGLVIGLSGRMTGIEFRGTRVTARSGTFLSALVQVCESAGLAGMECLAGIPGTVGGALIMNAGTGEAEIGDTVLSVSGLDGEWREVRLERESISFGYRSAPELQSLLLTEAEFELRSSSRDYLKQKRLELLRIRSEKQPLGYPSCGSVFKRPPGYYVGRMVQELDLKGFRRGDAMISEKHAGFIVNLGNAAADDILYLIKTVEERVELNFGVKLEREVRLLGY